MINAFVDIVYCLTSVFPQEGRYPGATRTSHLVYSTAIDPLAFRKEELLKRNQMNNPFEVEARLLLLFDLSSVLLRVSS